MHMHSIAYVKIALVIGILSAAGCAGLQTGSEFQAGRQALLKGQNETALAYFQSAAQKDPAYSYGTAYQQNVWSYVGRSQYALGRLPEARQTLERALSTKQDEDLTRLYLGLTLAKSGDRQTGLKEIEAGMKGIHDWLDYVTVAYRFSFGQYWDPARNIRSTIQGDLAMISGREFDWQKLIADGEWIAQRMEEEGDLARRDESRDRDRDSDSDSEP
jgi:tetratricopeptide (TPR) repeat protein